MHWAEMLASRVESEKKEPFTITAGMTTSGPTHLGTLCEFLFPSAIQKELVSEGKNCDYVFIADIFDAFDSVPSVFSKHEKELAAPWKATLRRSRPGGMLCVFRRPFPQRVAGGDEKIRGFAENRARERAILIRRDGRSREILPCERGAGARACRKDVAQGRAPGRMVADNARVPELREDSDNARGLARRRQL